MFVLRRISQLKNCAPSKMEQSNHYLGSWYRLIKKDENPELFQIAWNSSKEIPEQFFAVVIDEFSDTHFLMKNEENYIVAMGGKTFDNISYKYDNSTHSTE